tara:strand:+ start:5487 stop:5735 length:249 start_codon:yes stop_codon:yes gene_type:complete
MEDQTLNLLKHPVGTFQWNGNPNSEEIKNAIKELERFPEELKKSLAGVTTETLKNRYRPEGWTITQVIHHLADSQNHYLIGC